MSSLSYLRDLVFLRRSPSDSRSQTDRNILFLYLEIIFASALSIAVTFHSTFAIRLGASADTIALLNAVPFLVATVATIPGGRFMKSRRQRKKWLLGILMFFRAGHIVIALLPLLLPNNPVLASQIIVWWIIFLTLPNTLFDTEWRVTLGDLVPEQRRSFVFSRRSIINSLIIAVGTTVVGWLLNASAAVFPANYQMMYVLAFLATLGSHYYLSQLVIPDREFAPPKPEEKIVPKRSPMKMTPAMRRLLLISALYNFGIQFYVGVQTVHLVNNLKATDDWIGLISAAGSFGGIIGYYYWERWLRNHTIGSALRRASLITWFYPASLALFTNLGLITIGNFLVNLGHPGVDLASTRMLLELPHPEDRVAFTSRYIAIVSFCSFISPLLGVWLTEGLPISVPAVIFMSAVLRIIAGILFNIFRSESTPAAQSEAQTAPVVVSA